ncbi:MAG: hypothetical protein SH820_17515 [Xanthomonadales bacterium]|nr:hypothetical protein [Xanthomonadales bacterium]
MLTDFSAALILLIFLVFVPLIDLTIVPIRWMLAQELVNGYARRLSLCETFSESRMRMDADPSLRTKLHNLGGVTTESINLRLRITRIFRYPHAEEFILAEKPRQIPADWLPNGAKAPCSYQLELNVRSQMSPAILLPLKGVSIPGLTKPIPFLISSSHEWANCNPDPATGTFFLNE